MKEKNRIEAEKKAEKEEMLFMSKIIGLQKEFLSVKGIDHSEIDSIYDKITEVCLEIGGPVMPSFHDVVMQLDMLGRENGRFFKDYVNANSPGFLAEAVRKSCR